MAVHCCGGHGCSRWRICAPFPSVHKVRGLPGSHCGQSFAQRSFSLARRGTQRAVVAGDRDFRPRRFTAGLLRYSAAVHSSSPIPSQRLGQAQHVLSNLLCYSVDGAKCSQFRSNSGGRKRTHLAHRGGNYLERIALQLARISNFAGALTGGRSRSSLEMSGLR
jgi:hypothetical protein